MDQHAASAACAATTETPEATNNAYALARGLIEQTPGDKLRAFLSECDGSADAGSEAGVSLRDPANRAYREFGAIAVDLGYEAVPITLPGSLDYEGEVHKSAGKAPGWTNQFDSRFVPLKDWRGPILPEKVADWTCREAGLGVRTGGLLNLVGIDIDHSDAAIADELHDAATRTLGVTEMVRSRGNSAKRLLLYRCDAPQTKRAVAVTAAGEHKGKPAVEMLADGQQFVAIARHPSGAMYRWERQSLLGCRAEDVPLVTGEQIDAFFAEANAIAVARGLRSEDDEVESAPTERATTAGPSSKVDAETLKKLLERVPNDDLIYDNYYDVLQAINSSCSEPGRIPELIHGWASKSSKYNEKATNKHIRGLSRDRGEVKLGTLIKFAGGNAAVADLKLPDSDAWKAHASATPWTEGKPPEWADAHGNTWAGLRLLGKAAPETLPNIDELREIVAGRIHDAINVTAAVWHAGDKSRPLRWLNREATGASKTTAFTKAAATFLGSAAGKNWNVLYVAPNHAIAAQTAKQLRALGTPVVHVRGAAQLCKADDALRSQVLQRAKRGLAVGDVCKGCPLFKAGTCEYHKQKQPTAGHVIVAVLAHVKLDVIPPLDEDGSKPIYVTVFDENFTQSMIDSAKISFRDFIKPIEFPDINPTQRDGEDDAEFRMRLEGSKFSRHLVTEAVHRAHTALMSAVSKFKLHKTKQQQFAIKCREAADKLKSAGTPCEAAERKAVGAERHAASAAMPVEFIEPLLVADFGGPISRMDVLLIEQAEGVLVNLLLAAARAQGKEGRSIDLRSRNGALLSRVRHLRLCLRAINDCVSMEPVSGGPTKIVINRPDGLVPGLMVDERTTRPRKGTPPTTFLHITATSMAELPERVRRAPILALDATGNETMLAAVLREKAGQSDFRVFDGKASSPFAKRVKVVDAPVKAGQLHAKLIGGDKDRGQRKGHVVIGGQVRDNGDVIERTRKKVVQLAGLRSDAHAAEVERWLMLYDRIGRSEIEATKGRPARVGLFATKPYAKGVKLRSWAAHIDEGWHGNTQGSNRWAEHDLLFVVGQNRPPLDEVRNQAAAVAAATAQPSPHAAWDRVERETIIGEAVFAETVPGFDDPLMAEVYGQMCEAQSRQTEGRDRGSSRRSAAEQVVSFHLDQVGGGRYNDVLVFEPPAALEVFEAIHGRRPTSPSEAVDGCPDLFTGRKQAGWALSANAFQDQSVPHRRVAL